MAKNDEPATTTAEELAEAGPDDDLPSGSHALEVAARRGFGPLSAAAKQTWHGNAIPCVTCGQLVMRGALQCDHCGQDLRTDMVDKMRAHAGPWFVLEHLRPFPGVSLDRIIRQIRRGLITETSIVRGPATDFHWCFAVETRGLCRFFGKCWHCHHGVTASDVYCPACLSHLSFEEAKPTLLGAPTSASLAPPSRTNVLPLTRPHVAPPLVGGAPFAAPRPITPPPAKASPSPYEARPPVATSPMVAAAPPLAPSVNASPELADLANTVRSLGTVPTPHDFEPSPGAGSFRTGWIVLIAAIVTLAALLGIVQYRSNALTPPAPAAQTAP